MSKAIVARIYNSIGFPCQEYIDFKNLFRYKKASTEKEEACQWDSVEALSKENPQRHSLNSVGIYQQNGYGSNAIHYGDDRNSISINRSRD